jgi:hypothetical protein
MKIPWLERPLAEGRLNVTGEPYEKAPLVSQRGLGNRYSSN